MNSEVLYAEREQRTEKPIVCVCVSYGVNIVAWPRTRPKPDLAVSHSISGHGVNELQRPSHRADLGYGHGRPLLSYQKGDSHSYTALPTQLLHPILALPHHPRLPLHKHLSETSQSLSDITQRNQG